MSTTPYRPRLSDEAAETLAELRDDLGISNNDVILLLRDFLPSKEDLEIINKAAKMSSESRAAIVQRGAITRAKTFITAIENEAESTKNRPGSVAPKLRDAIEKLSKTTTPITPTNLFKATNCNYNSCKRFFEDNSELVAAAIAKQPRRSVSP